ncbi:Hsp20 family protein [Candidatus Bathyarchaeota archaeon]|nr:Hsp20 family protein [Candidatus Bathyarchaeota archaeon]
MANEDESKKEEIEVWTPEEVFKTYDRMFKDFRRNVLETWTKSPITEPSYWEKSVIPRMMQKPPVNLVDEDNAFKLTAEAPGFDKDDIEITENKLNMTGKRKETKEVSKEDYRLNEIRSRNFKRSISFPEKILSD